MFGICRHMWCPSKHLRTSFMNSRVAKIVGAERAPRHAVGVEHDSVCTAPFAQSGACRRDPNSLCRGGPQGCHPPLEGHTRSEVA